jgi:hypothetical protein
MAPLLLVTCNCSNSGIYTDETYNLGNFLPFFHKVSVIFNTLLPTLSKTLYTIVVKFPSSTSKHATKTMFQFVVICKMAFHVVHNLQGHKGSSKRVPDVGCEQDGQEQSIPFLRSPHVCAS